MEIFRDKYTDFSFNDINSSKMKVWITNNQDIQLNMAPNFSDNFQTPSAGDFEYYSGTSLRRITLPVVRCIAINITMNEWRLITEWLSPLKVGRLRFDFNIGTYYWAKLTSAPSGVAYVKSSGNNIAGDRYHIEFGLSFTTVDDYAALGEINIGELGRENIDVEFENQEEVYNFFNASRNSYFFPLLYTADNGKENYRIYNTGSYQAYPNFQISNINTDVTIEVDGIRLYSYHLLNPSAIELLDFYGDRGLVMHNNKMAEDAKDINGFFLIRNSLNRGRCAIPSGKPELLRAKVKEKDEDTLKLYIEPFAYGERIGEKWSAIMFKDYKHNSEFDGDKFPIALDGEEYPIQMKEPVFIPDGIIIQEKDGYYEIDFSQISDNQIKNNLSEYGEGDNCFISICNYSTLKIQQLYDSESALKGFVTMQTRGIT